jgi:hypothetical protein
MIRLLGWLLGVRVDLIDRREAALVFMEREVTFSWRPVVVEQALEPSVVSRVRS